MKRVRVNERHKKTVIEGIHKCIATETIDNTMEYETSHLYGTDKLQIETHRHVKNVNLAAFLSVSYEVFQYT